MAENLTDSIQSVEEVDADDDNQLVSLADFMAATRKDLDAFEATYNEGLSKQPDLFQAEMSLPDWFEQLIVHLTGWDEAGATDAG